MFFYYSPVFKVVKNILEDNILNRRKTIGGRKNFNVWKDIVEKKVNEMSKGSVKQENYKIYIWTYRGI